MWEVISGGSRIFKREGGGHKIMDACCLYKHTFLITKTKRWEVVKNSASPKGTFFFVVVSCHFPPLCPPPPPPRSTIIFSVKLQQMNEKMIYKLEI